VAYTGITFGQLKNQLAERLNDNRQFWPDQELGLHLQDALRFWNVLTGENRTSFSLPIQQANPIWYDLNTIANSPRLCSLTDRDVYLRLTYALLEAPSNIGQLTTGQFVSDEIINAVQRKRDEFIFQTSCTSTILSLAGASLVPFPQSVIQAFRAYWLPTAIKGSPVQPNPLFRIDDFAIAAYSPNPGNPAQPLAFSAGAEAPLTAQIIPPPNVPGNVEFITVQTQAALTQGNATTLLLPNDFIGALLWGSLADLLSQSLTAEDPTRAALAKQRYEEYIALMDVYPFVLAAQSNGVPIMVDAVENLDTYSPAWRTTVANPGVVGLSGSNLVAFPTNQNMLLNLFMVGNAIVPAADADFIQLGGEVLDVILDEAQATASFKMGGAEAVSAFQLHGNIIKLAAKKNAKIRALSCFRDVLYGRVNRENRAAPKEVTYDQA
jgi:hypothetical protein